MKMLRITKRVTSDYITKNTGLIIFIYDINDLHLEQTRHNKCGHYFRRRMPAVWERIRVRQLYRNALTTDFTQAFQNCHNNLWML